MPDTAVRLQPRPAVVALPAGVDHAADSHPVPDREPGHLGPRGGHDAGYPQVGDLTLSGQSMH
ncbi:hypothetical protein HEP84_55545 [Streptomyces sp. RLB1-33]|uniref:hypothetical protein n=1 Tax=Streptomyces mirabilis TaxID=68239 RepID=UPI0032B4F953